jgi:hypothetical protein
VDYILHYCYTPKMKDLKDIGGTSITEKECYKF